jgi:hypothetical protein
MYLRPRLTYPLSCTSLTQKQCKNVQAPALAALLPKMHLNRHTPHAVLFGDYCFGGLSLPDLYTDQGFNQLKFFIGRICLQDDVGQLILIAISYIQILPGVQKPFFFPELLPLCQMDRPLLVTFDLEIYKSTKNYTRGSTPLDPSETKGK